MGICISTLFGFGKTKTEDQNTKLLQQQESLTFSTNGSSVLILPKLDDFKILKLIGRGSSGKVVLAEQKQTLKLFAMKILDKSQLKANNHQNNVKAEKMILQKTKHSFIIRLFYAFQSDTHLYLGTEFINGGELFTHLRKNFNFTEERTRFYAAEIVLALKYLHENEIIYRDLKPENILLDSYGHLKLTDFGLSKMQFQKVTYTTCGTPEYVAPEILFEQGYNQSVDWYSLGILIYEMLSGAPPFYSQDKNKMIEDRLSKPIEMPLFFSKEAISLINGLAAIESEQRLGNNNVQEILNHPFFANIDWKALLKREIEPPYRPIIEGRLDLRNFDPQFTEQPFESPRMDISKQQFYEEFTYYNLNQDDNNYQL